MALDFNGSTDRVDYTSVFNPRGVSCTVAGWLYLDALDHISYFLAVNDSGNSAPVNIIYVNTNGRLSYQWYGTTGNGWWVGEAATNTILTGVWTHIAFVVDLSVGTWENMCRLYKNGSECSYASRSYGWVGGKTVTGLMSIGGKSTADDRNFNGRLAEYGLWNRVLTTDEIRSLAQGYSPFMIPRSLLWAPQLVNSAKDYISNQAGTLDGTSVYQHPNILYAANPIVGRHYEAPTPPEVSSKPFYFNQMVLSRRYS